VALKNRTPSATLSVGRLAGVLVSLLVTACAHYTPQPLADKAALAPDIKSLSITPANQGGKASGPVLFNPSDGLNLGEIAALAALNNPDLKAQRTSLQVADAQVFAAGLLPDPQLSYGLDKPTGDTRGLVDAWSAGIGYDIVPLLTRSARHDVARQTRRKVRLDLLWQEWQVIQQARTLAVRAQLEARRLDVLETMRALYDDRYRRSSRALQEGDITLDVNGTDLTALLDTLSQISQLEQAHNQTRHDLNLLLGLAPDVPLKLSPLPPPTDLDRGEAQRQLARLPELRPDLLALKAGYQSQEAAVRAAVLAQFPSLGIGLNRASDTSDVHTTGISVTLTLPLLSGNRGNIATERATRAQLRAQYQARLAQAQTDVDSLLGMQGILRGQLQNLHTYLPSLKTLVDRGRTAYERRDIDALTFLNMESTWVNKRLEEISLTQSIWETRIALGATLALPEFPAPLPAPRAKTASDSP
jgi:outer membrane protein TolC